MFGLLYNFYQFCKKKAERKITLAVLGLDNAGKTTLLNSIQGEGDKDTTPTFGFNSTSVQEGKYKIEVFDLGGGKSIRSVWKKYLAEVHAIVYVVDAADSQRFEESKKTLVEVLESQYMRDKPIVVFANKQDLPTAATAAEIVKSLGLASCKNSYNVFACTAKVPAGQPVDARLREGLRWLIGSVDREFSRLDPRVQAEAEEVRQEEARKKKEREERLRRQREERLRQQKEEEERAREIERENALHDGQAPVVLGTAPAQGAEGHGEGPEQAAGGQGPGGLAGALHPGLAMGLPHTIESPGKLPMPAAYPKLLNQQLSDLRAAANDQARTGSDGGAAAADGHHTVTYLAALQPQGSSSQALPMQELSPPRTSAARPSSASTNLAAAAPPGLPPRLPGLPPLGAAPASLPHAAAASGGSGGGASGVGLASLPRPHSRQELAAGPGPGWLPAAGALSGPGSGPGSRGSSARSSRRSGAGEEHGEGAGEGAWTSKHGEGAGGLQPSHSQGSLPRNSSGHGMVPGGYGSGGGAGDVQDERGKTSLRSRLGSPSSGGVAAAPGPGAGGSTSDGGHRGSFSLVQHNRVVPVAPD